MGHAVYLNTQLKSLCFDQFAAFSLLTHSIWMDLCPTEAHLAAQFLHSVGRTTVSRSLISSFCESNCTLSCLIWLFIPYSWLKFAAPRNCWISHFLYLEEELSPTLVRTQKYTSISNQNYLTDYEIIILDSESIDRTRELAVKFAKVKFFSTSKKKFNFGASCNQISKLCTKDIIIFLSGHVDIINNDFISCLDKLIYKKEIKILLFCLVLDDL